MKHYEDAFSAGVAEAVAIAMGSMSADELRQLAVGAYLEVRENLMLAAA